MILEGIVTTVGPDGAVNIAPMGPRVTPDMARFVLRPYKTAQTYRNLKALGEGVLHVTDDVLLLARAAIGPVACFVQTTFGVALARPRIVVARLISMRSYVGTLAVK